MTPQPPDYILVIPRENEVPEIQASCDKEDLYDLKQMKQKGWFIYKRIGKMSPVVDVTSPKQKSSESKKEAGLT